MKYVKMLGLLAVAAAALMAFAGTASSATLTEGVNDDMEVGDTIHASSEGATSLTGTINVTCQKSTVGGTVTDNGMTSASGHVETLTFEECGDHTVTVVNKGTLKIEGTGTNTGVVTSSGAEVTITLHSKLLGTVHCIYTTSGTHIGTLTGTGHANNLTTGATLDINSVSIPRTVTDSACGTHATWEGNYTVSNPTHLYVD